MELPSYYLALQVGDSTTVTRMGTLEEIYTLYESMSEAFGMTAVALPPDGIMAMSVNFAERSAVSMMVHI